MDSVNPTVVQTTQELLWDQASVCGGRLPTFTPNMIAIHWDSDDHPRSANFILQNNVTYL